MFEMTEARSMGDFRDLREVLNEMALWDAAETRALGQDPTVLLAECYSDTPEALMATHTAPGAAMFLAREAGHVAGCAGFSPVHDGLAELQKVYARPDHRGQGLGRSLLNRALTAMVAFGYQAVRLETATFMVDAQKLYRRSGFLEIAPFRPPLGDLDDMSVYMGRDLSDLRPGGVTG